MYVNKLGFFWKIQFVLSMAVMFGILSPIAKAVAVPGFELLKSVGQKEGNPSGKLVQDADGNLYGTTSNGGDNGLGTIYKIDKSETYSVLHSFDGTFDPRSYGQIQAGGGKLFGIINYYGIVAKSEIFQLDTSGAKPVYSILHEFIGGIDELIQGSDGKFYGVGAYGTTETTVFQLDLTGANPVYTALYQYDGIKGTKRIMFQGKDGKLYGNTNGDYGTSKTEVFQLDISGSKPVYTVLHELDGFSQDGVLVQGRDGKLYGTTYQSYIGSNPSYILEIEFFRLDISGASPAYTILHTIPLYKGGHLTSFIKGGDGKFYGAISNDFAEIAISYFQLDASGVTPAYTFLNEAEYIAAPEMIFQGSGRLYMVNFGGSIFQLETSGTTPILQTFDPTYGLGSLIQGNDGNLYGTSNNVVFQLDTSGSALSLKVLHKFELLADTGSGAFGMFEGSGGKIYGLSPGDGMYQLDISGVLPNYTRFFNIPFLNTPFYGEGSTDLYPYPGYIPIQGSKGKFLGSTKTLTAGHPPCNTSVFQADTSGMMPIYNALYSFEICLAPSRMIEGSSGKYYGITGDGGSHGYGVIFRLDTSGVMPTYTVLHDFDQPSYDGGTPALTLGSDGKLYGSTSTGINENNSTGTVRRELPYNISVFQLETSAANPVYTVLYSYSDDDYNGSPSSMIEGSDGKLYFTTHQLTPEVYAYPGSSILFQLDITPTTPVRTIVHEFNIGNGGDYWLPTSDLIKGSDGNIYGVTTGWLNGGVTGSDYGSVYQVNTSGTKLLYTELYKFNGTIGGNPSGLLQASDGNLYGGTRGGGQFNGGVIYRLRMPKENTPPVAANDSFALSIPKKNTPITIAAPGVLGNDKDAEGKVLAVFGATAAKPKIIEFPQGGGKVALYADGHFVYTPGKKCFYGTRSFTYQVTDGQDASNPATVTLTTKRPKQEHGKHEGRKHED